MAYCYQQGRTDYSGLRVLLTEDNALCAEIMTELLTLRHATVRCARSGEEAVQLMGQADGEFDAVLMDVQMPGMDGYETTRAIRSMGRGANIPVFAMTASGEECDRRRAYAAGMNAFLQKPFELALFDQALCAALS